MLGYYGLNQGINSSPIMKTLLLTLLLSCAKHGDVHAPSGGGIVASEEKEINATVVTSLGASGGTCTTKK